MSSKSEPSCLKFGGRETDGPNWPDDRAWTHFRHCRPNRPLEKSLAFAPSNLDRPPFHSLPSTQLQVNCNCSPFVLRTSRTLSNMFRNALRQSTRVVGAVSASGRAVAVSRSPPRPIDPNAIEKALNPRSIHHPAVSRAQWPSLELG